MSDNKPLRVDYRGELSPDTIVYRVIGRESRINAFTQKPVQDEFKRRPPLPDGKIRDEGGVSFVVCCGLSFDDLADILKDRLYCYAFASVRVGDIVSLPVTPPLVVVKDGDYHVSLKGLPAGGANEAEANRLADILAELSTVEAWRNPQKREKS